MAAHFQHIAARGQLEGRAGVLLHQQHGDALLVDGAHGLEDGTHQERSQAQRRFVQQEQARPGHEGAPDGQHLLLAAGQRARQLLLALEQAREQLEDPLQGPFAAFLVADAEGPQAQVLQHAHGAEHATAFGRLGDAQVHHFVAGVFEQGLAVKDDGQQGRALARAVGAQDGHDLPFVHVQVDTVQHFHAAVTDMYVG